MSSFKKPVIHVACAVIHDPERDSFLMGQRAEHKHHGGYWEFIGGKMDPEDESIQHTMEREIEEEIGAKSKAGEVLTTLDHDYLNGPHVLLEFISVKLIDDQIKPDPDVYQKVDWIKRQHLLDLELSEGDFLFAKTLVHPEN